MRLTFSFSFPVVLGVVRCRLCANSEFFTGVSKSEALARVTRPRPGFTSHARRKGQSNGKRSRGDSATECARVQLLE